MECINISSDLHVKLRFEGFPLPDYISNSKGSKIRKLDMLTNYPTIVETSLTIMILNLLEICCDSYTIEQKECRYFTSTLRFVLQLRYSSNAAYNLLSQYMPLPSQRLLRCLKSDSIDSIKALSKLREEVFF